MVAKLIIILSVLLLNPFGLKESEKVFHAQDRFTEEFIVLNADNNTGVIIDLFKEHHWYGESDFKYMLNGDTLRIDFVDNKNASAVLLAKRNKLKKISYSKSLFFKKYHRISTKKFNEIDFEGYY
jgi:hypothetical protein